MEWKDIEKAAIGKIIKLKLPESYFERFKAECQQINLQGANEYWLDAIAENKKFIENQNGLVLPFLLGMTDVDPIKAGIEHRWERHPDVPDVDCDFLPEARDKIKTYISGKYGENCVCSIGTWQSYQPRLGMQDAARALGKNLNQVIKITKMLPEDFDEMDKEAALMELTADEISPEYKQLAEYYKTEDGKLVVDVAFRMVGLLKTQGKHAAGFIISDKDLFGIIPMSRLSGLWTSQWTEGHSSQLSKFGLVKWDILGLKTMFYIHRATQLVKENGKQIDLPACDACGGTGLNGDEPFPEYGDKCLECSGSGVCWENIDYDLPDVLNLANEMKTESIFQFETDLAKSIIKKGGVKSLRDLLVYTSLGRPGPLPLVDEYIARRDGKRWMESEHPMVVNLFEDTFGLVVFQEQLQRYWVEVCGFTVPEAEAARKAVAKKWGDKLEKVMKRAEDGAAKRIGREEAVKWNERIKTFGRYAFNACLDADTMIEDPTTGEVITIEDLYLNKRNFNLLSYQNGEFIPDSIKDVHYNGIRPIYEVTFTNDMVVSVTDEHKFLNEFGHYETLSDLIISNHAIKHMSGGVTKNANKTYRRRRIEGGRSLQEWENVRRNNRGIAPQIHITQHCHQDSEKIWCKKEISDEAWEHGESRFLRRDRQIRESILDRVSDCGWVCTRSAKICESTTQTKRYGGSGPIREGYGIIEKDDVLRKGILWEEKFSSQANSQQFENGARFGKTWCDTRENWKRNSRRTIYKSSTTWADGWGRINRSQWEGVSNDQIDVCPEMCGEIQRRYCAEMPCEEQQDNEIFRSNAWGSMVRSKSMQEDSRLLIRGVDQGSAKEGNCGTCHIKSVRFVGFRRVYSPEMQSESHNYLIRPEIGQPVHRNSHATSYVIISYMCLFMKTKYPTEWWAAVLTVCHKDKMPRYVGMAKSEKVEFANLHCDHLTRDFGVKGDVVLPGLLGIKGLGDKSISRILGSAGTKYSSLDHFLQINGDNKTVMERLIKLGAFDHLGHNRSSLWAWYLYKRKDKEMMEWLRRKTITDEELDRKRKEFVERYVAEHPKRNVPKKVSFWMPDLDFKFEEVDVMIPRWDSSKITQFEREYYGYYFTSPMSCYEVAGHDIKDAKETGIVECIIQDNEMKTTKNGVQYLRLEVIDGKGTATIIIWDVVSQIIDSGDIEPGSGIRAEVMWDDKFGTFSVKRRTKVLPLMRKRKKIKNAS